MIHTSFLHKCVIVGLAIHLHLPVYTGVSDMKWCRPHSLILIRKRRVNAVTWNNDKDSFNTRHH